MPWVELAIDEMNRPLVDETYPRAPEDDAAALLAALDASGSADVAARLRALFDPDAVRAAARRRRYRAAYLSLGARAGRRRACVYALGERTREALLRASEPAPPAPPEPPPDRAGEGAAAAKVRRRARRARARRLAHARRDGRRTRPPPRPRRPRPRARARRRRSRARARAPLRGAAVGGADASRVDAREALALIAADGDARRAARARAQDDAAARARQARRPARARATARAGTLWEEIAVLEQAAELVDLVIEVAPYAGTRASGMKLRPFSPPQVAPCLAPAALVAALRARACAVSCRLLDNDARGRVVDDVGARHALGAVDEGATAPFSLPAGSLEHLSLEKPGSVDERAAAERMALERGPETPATRRRFCLRACATARSRCGRRSCSTSAWSPRSARAAARAALADALSLHVCLATHARDPADRLLRFGAPVDGDGDLRLVSAGLTEAHARCSMRSSGTTAGCAASRAGRG